jgi:hypothetical protein
MKWTTVKKATLFFIIIGCYIVIISCSGKPGDVYLKYSWVSVPLYFYDENPSTPSIVYNDQYFYTEPGSYYMEYTAWDGSDWWGIYTLTENSGKAFFVNGEDALFEIALYSSGPSIYKWQSIVGQPDVMSIKNAHKDDKNFGNSTASTISKDTLISTQEITNGEVTLTIEFGKQ